jgi:hypothetical protein
LTAPDFGLLKHENHYVVRCKSYWQGKFVRKKFIEFLKRYALMAGRCLMFLLTRPIDFANAGILYVKIPYVISTTFGWGIIFASLIMTILTLDKNGAIDLLKHFLIWRVSSKW